MSINPGWIFHQFFLREHIHHQADLLLSDGGDTESETTRQAPLSLDRLGQL